MNYIEIKLSSSELNKIMPYCVAVNGVTGIKVHKGWFNKYKLTIYFQTVAQLNYFNDTLLNK